jgi:hypothetical protein
MFDVLQELSISWNKLQSRTITLPITKKLIKRRIRIIEVALKAKSKLIFNDVKLILNKKSFP